MLQNGMRNEKEGMVERDELPQICKEIKIAAILGKKT